MERDVPISTLSYLVCGIVEYLMGQEGDLEAGLKEIGYETGIKLLEIYRFEREIHMPTLLYRLTFDFLTKINNVDRKIEHVDGEKDVYLLTDFDSVFSKFISVTQEWEDFSADSIVCGVVQAVIMASGSRSEVTAFQKPTDKSPNRVIFQVKILPLI